MHTQLGAYLNCWDIASLHELLEWATYRQLGYVFNDFLPLWNIGLTYIGLHKSGLLFACRWRLLSTLVETEKPRYKPRKKAILFIHSIVRFVFHTIYVGCDFISSFFRRLKFFRIFIRRITTSWRQLKFLLRKFVLLYWSDYHYQVCEMLLSFSDMVESIIVRFGQLVTQSTRY